MDNLKIQKGLTEKQIKQLVEYTKSDPDILKFTSDLERFGTEEKYQDWLKKMNPTIYSLIDPEGNLVGIGWHNKKELPSVKFTTHIDQKNFPFTNGVRIYGSARGKGLGSWFYKFILDSCPANTWNMISVDNIPSIKLHQKMGFTKVSKPDQNGKIVMIKTIDKWKIVRDNLANARR